MKRIIDSGDFLNKIRYETTQETEKSKKGVVACPGQDMS